MCVQAAHFDSCLLTDDAGYGWPASRDFWQGVVPDHLEMTSWADDQRGSGSFRLKAKNHLYGCYYWC